MQHRHMWPANIYHVAFLQKKFPDPSLCETD